MANEPDRWLIDTNVLSEMRRGHQAAHAVQFWMANVLQPSCFVSVVTIAELEDGVASTPDPDKRALLSAWLQGVVRPQFTGRVLGVSEAVLLVWLGLLRSGRRQGLTYAAADALIAATAIVHGLTIVTRNVRDFARTGAALFNPWIPT